MSNAEAGSVISPFRTLANVQTRLTEAVLGRHGFNHPALTAEIRRLFGSSDVERGAIAQEPVIEAAFPYVTGDQTLDQLSGRLLHPKVVDALSSGGLDRQYVFPRSLKPYAHQVETWTLLRDATPRSVLVSSGTGSGKTECFMVPLLDDLAREVSDGGRLSGVRAIALYPLNALIASQEERLREWTRPFNGQIRFGLYNGLMPEDLKAAGQRREQVEDRRTLRADPPPILVTNITMLEYMTVRRQDRPLIERSSGKLRWIILDEAHSYVGSRAAEVALLIRRVLLAFNVKPTDVRFVATSATIGQGLDVEVKLKAFLRDVAGIPDDRVHVVVGRHLKPILPPPGPAKLLSASDLDDPQKLKSNPAVQNLMRLFDKSVVKWSSFSEMASKVGVGGDALARALTSKPKGVDAPILPIRVHGFVRGVQGIFSCLNPGCGEKVTGWPFGAILPEAVQRCPHCQSTVLEIERCDECGEPYLYAVERQGRLSTDARLAGQDEFAADSDNEAEFDDEVESEDVSEADTPDVFRRLSVRDLGRGHVLHADPVSGEVRDAPGRGTLTLQSHDFAKCPACDCEPAAFKKVRSGAPFLVGNAAPVLLDGVLARDDASSQDEPSAYGGRQLLSFTDSRQGTARFAALLQNGSERNFIRAAIYHAVQDTLRPQPGADRQIADLEQQIAKLESVAAAAGLGDLLENLKKQREALISPSGAGLSWATLRDQMSVRPEIDVLMRRVWRFRDQRFDQSSRAFTEFLMLRELARRPVRAIALETLGLATLRYPVIEQLSEARLPRLFATGGLGIGDYREFLRALLTILVRGAFAIRTDPENIHWFSGHLFQRRLTPPASDAAAAEAAGERGRWPSPGGRSAVLLLLDRVLKIDRSQANVRAEVGELLKQAWDDLLPLFAQPGAGGSYALDFEKVNVAPVGRAFLCPATRVLTDISIGGLSPFGFGRKNRFAAEPPEVVDMPVHPNAFLLPDQGGAVIVEAWLQEDPAITRLRSRGLWTNIHDRIALESPYFRAAEHSAQQPPARLRSYERQFKAGGINVLNCSTTMEMGVDIGSVSTVMMTNVPPSVANYRQRVGRAGRRGQGFAMALTYARPTPLDRETFRDPVGYLSRQIEAPKVTLDSKRIVQRHVNALLLAEWFRSANGEPLRTKIGEFFGCSAAIGAKREPDSASAKFQQWTGQAGVVTAMTPLIATLVRGSSLSADPGLFVAAAEAMRAAETSFVSEWEAVQAQAASMDRDAAKMSIGFQLQRMCGENLLGELADRGVLPGHGFPTDVVSFVNKDQPDKDEDADGGENRFRYRNYPSRNLDIAIRDYAPGAEIVLDGLVYESAGVTLNWKRPAGESDVKEIQSLRWFWECRNCGGAATSVIKHDDCPVCGVELEPERTVRFLRPSGFTADMRTKPHAEIDEVAFIEPEPERVSTRGAEWQPFPSGSFGRVRSSREGLVFYSSKGGSGQTGYSVCLECGRAEADHVAVGTPGFQPLRDHRPLRFTRGDAEGKCPGNGRSFSIQTGLALGHEISTDVVEIQPAKLEREKAAWALASALREALTRRLGVESGELGIAISSHPTSIGGRTHSIFLYDRAAGGAGFAPRLLDLFPEAMKDARSILECRRPGCVTCCSSCVLTGDLATRSDMLDRRLAIEFLDRDLGELGAPDPADMCTQDAALSLDVADELIAQAAPGSVVTLWPTEDLDPASIGSIRTRFLIDKLRANGGRVLLCFDGSALSAFDPSQKLAVRDAAIRHGFEIATGARPKFPNGAFAVAAISTGRLWACRDADAGRFGDDWGLGRQAPVVWATASLPSGSAVSLDALLPISGTRYAEIGKQFDGPSLNFQDRFVGVLRRELEQTGLWRPGKLTRIEYSDRYLNSPLAVHLALKAMAGLAAKLVPGAKAELQIVTAPLREPSDRPPYRFNHDWQDERIRAEIVKLYGQRLGMQPFLTVDRCPHSRKMKLIYDDGEAIIVFDQGFGFLRTASSVSFDFRGSSSDQERKLASINVLLNAEGSSFFVVTPGRSK